MTRRNFTISRWQPIQGYDGTIVGRSDGRVFKKTIRGSVHMLRRPPAIAIDAQAYETKIAPNHQQIQVWDSESNKLYVTTIEEFNMYKRVLDRGYGRQVFLVLKYWHVRDLNPGVPYQTNFLYPGIGFYV